MKKNYIVIYAEDFDRDVWEDYCLATNVPTSAISITIYFNDKDVEYIDEEEDEDDEN